MFLAIYLSMKRLGAGCWVAGRCWALCTNEGEFEHVSVSVQSINELLEYNVYQTFTAFSTVALVTVALYGGHAMIYRFFLARVPSDRSFPRVGWGQEDGALETNVLRSSPVRRH